MADSVLFVGPLDRVLFLRTVAALEGLEPSELAAIAQHARERSFPRGSTLIAPTSSGETAYLIVDGEVSVERRGRASQQLGPGDAVGLLDLLARSHQELEVRATSDTLTLELDWDAQMDVCEEHFAVLLQYMRYVAKRTIGELQRRVPEETPADGGGPHIPLGPQLNFVERILVLSRSHAFSTGSLDALTELAHHVTEVRLEAGTSLWHPGDPADHFLLIVSGVVRGVLPDGWAFTRRSMGTVGMLEALRRDERWHEAISPVECRALRIDVEPFLDILEDHFDLAIDFTSTLAQSLLELERAHGNVALPDSISVRATE